MTETETETVRIVTNNVPRLVLDASDLTAKERAEFDYLDWDALERGEASASFVRYRGVTYDLGEFTYNGNLSEFSPLRSWDGHLSDSFFSGVVIRYVDPDADEVIVGTFFA